MKETLGLLQQNYFTDTKDSKLWRKGIQSSQHFPAITPSTFISTKFYLTFCLHAKILYRSHPQISPYLVIFLDSTIFLRARHESTCSYFSCLQIPHRQRSLTGCSPWGCKELYTTEPLDLTEQRFRIRMQEETRITKNSYTISRIKYPDKRLLKERIKLAYVASGNTMLMTTKAEKPSETG